MAKIRDIKEFPTKSMSKRAFGIYPRKGIVEVDGFKYFSLKELKRIPLNDRLSLPHELFVAIHKA